MPHLVEFTEILALKQDEIIADIGEVGESLFYIIPVQVAQYFADHGADMAPWKTAI